MSRDNGGFQMFPDLLETNQIRKERLKCLKEIFSSSSHNDDEWKAAPEAVVILVNEISQCVGFTLCW